MIPAPNLSPEALNVFEVSKSDGLFDLAELLLELLAYPIGRMLGKTSPHQSLALWGWPEWLWFATVVFIIVTLVRRHKRKKRESAVAETAKSDAS